MSIASVYERFRTVPSRALGARGADSVAGHPLPARRTVFHRILLATDFSKASERALTVAAGLAHASAARLTLLYVYNVSLAGTPAEEAERTWPGAIQVREHLDRMVTNLRSAGLHVDGVVRFGVAPVEIAELALQKRVDLVVTGTHGRKGLARVWYGSVAAQVVRRSSAAVLVVPTDGTNVVAIRFR
jgi:nucleotide-binding universal stress UspA family protein